MPNEQANNSNYCDHNETSYRGICEYQTQTRIKRDRERVGTQVWFTLETRR